MAFYERNKRRFHRNPNTNNKHQECSGNGKQMTPGKSRLRFSKTTGNSNVFMARCCFNATGQNFKIAVRKKEEASYKMVTENRKRTTIFRGDMTIICVVLFVILHASRSYCDTFYEDLLM